MRVSQYEIGSHDSEDSVVFIEKKNASYSVYYWMLKNLYILSFCETRTKRVLKYKSRNLDPPPLPPTDVTDMYSMTPN